MTAKVFDLVAESRRMRTPWTLNYNDGAGNGYTLASDHAGARWSYAPVRPERSSSGVYDGGQAIDDARLDASACAELLALVADIRTHAGPGPRTRTMGSGLLRWRSGADDGRLLLGHASCQRLDAWFHDQRDKFSSPPG